MDGTNPETELVELVGQLRQLARAPAEATTFAVTCDGLTVDGFCSGGLMLTVPYDHAVGGRLAGGGPYRGDRHVSAIRPMRVVLRPEAPSDEESKHESVDVEHQTGDLAFDAAVYIDAPSPEPLAHLFDEDARAAILELFALGFTEIAIDDADGRIRATIVAYAQLPKPAANTPAGARALAAFVRLARSLPPVSSAPGAHPVSPLLGLTGLLWALAAISFFAAAPVYFMASASHLCSDHQPFREAMRCVLPGVGGGVGGAVVGAILVACIRPMLGARLKGTSSSSLRVSGILGATFILSVFGIGSVIALLLARM